MSRTGRLARAAACAALICASAAWSPAARAETGVAATVGGVRVRTPVKSFLELRWARLVRQQWDTSCGAAVMSTLLTYHLGRPMTEFQVAAAILKTTDPVRVRARGGFSLLDLKRLADGLGFVAKGYRGLTLGDLVGFGTAAILPVRIRGYDHFVVFRAAAAGRVFLGDPAFGNLTLTTGRFAEIWPSGIGFVVLPKGTAPPPGRLLNFDKSKVAVPNMRAVQRMIRGGGPVPPTRRPPGLRP